MPSLTEMLYLFAVSLRSSTAANLLHGSFALLTAIGLVAFGRRLRDRQLGLTAAALYYLLPFVTNLAETARIDLATTFFAFLAGTSMHRYLFDAGSGGETGDGERAKPLWLSALATGLAMATKYTAAPLVLLPLSMMLLIYPRQPRVAYRNVVTRSVSANRQSAIGNRQWPLFLLLSLVPVLPWLAKNLIFTGNPVYPIAQGLFHSPQWDDARSKLFLAHHTPSFRTLHDWACVVTCAWKNSMNEAYASPILLLFAPLFVLLGKLDPREKFCAWLGGLIYLAWFVFTFHPWRFLFPALPWFALLGAMAIKGLPQTSLARWSLRVALVAMLAFNLNFCFLLSASDVSEPDRVPPQISKLGIFLGQTRTTDYLQKAFGEIGWMNANLPDDACVLYVGETCIYYSRHRVLANTVFDRSLLGDMVDRARTPEDLLALMRARGITHIYLNQDEVDRLRRSYGYLRDMNWALFYRFLQTHATVLFRNERGSHVVFALETPR